MAKYVILDTETTGASESDRIIQLGYMVLEASKPVQVFNAFCSSEVPISIGAMEVHGITPEMIEGQPPCTKTQAYQYLESINDAANYIIIHNAPFDLGMLKHEGFTCKMQVIDTLRCAKHVFDDHETHRLQYFRYAMDLYKEEAKEAASLGIEVKAHDAIGDVLVLKLFLTRLKEALMQKFPGMNPIDKMVALTQEPVMIKQFRFGKYRGKMIADMALQDPGYLRWMQGNMELDEDMKYTLAMLLDH
jgi:DNA polymerase III epsilon subunit-like protein